MSTEVTVRHVVETAQHLRLRLRAGAAGLDRTITSPRIQKAALAVSGYAAAVRPGRVQVLGATEIDYLSGQSHEQRRQVFQRLCRSAPVTCYVVTRDLEPPPELLEAAEAAGIPVLTTMLASSACIDGLQAFLDERLAPRTSVHGNLVDVYGLGVLLLGESGIGKSECALDLISRGHRLVSDDTVSLRRGSGGVVVGSCPELTLDHLEIRGLGVLNIRDLFGVSATRNNKFVELVVMLEPWQEGKAYDRVGLDEAGYAILEIELPLIRMPVVPGRNLAMLVEVAARNQLLKLRGYNAAWSFVDRVHRQIARNTRRQAESLPADEASEPVDDGQEEPPAL